MTIERFGDEARRLAHEAVDVIFDHIANIEQRPVVDWTPFEELRELIRADRSPIDAIKLVAEKSIQLHHPSYIGHQVCPPFAPSVIADFVISALNNSTAVWEMSPIGTVIEREVIRWLADLAGYPAESEGTAVSGGSAANLTALLAARAWWLEHGGERPVIVASADAHYSVARAAAIMGVDDVEKIG
ncbi:MAG TPA: pyridoxal-dependent decarboxylase, partial [Thermoanaerobaculia bacterium]